VDRLWFRLPVVPAYLGRMMNWTNETPTQPGFYWYRSDHADFVAGHITILYLIPGAWNDTLVAYEPMDEYHPTPVGHLRGQWAGPLDPPA
jgi:hypothetical protein